MIAKEPQKSFGIMGAAVKQDAAKFEKSQSYLRWQDKAANQMFFGGELQAFLKEAQDVLLATGVIKAKINLDTIVDASFVK
jgi:NitT/TauT family transport system substrate-binding protein